MSREWTTSEKVIIGSLLFGTSFFLLGHALVVSHSDLFAVLLLGPPIFLLLFVFLKCLLFTIFYYENFSYAYQYHHGIIIAHGKPNNLPFYKYPCEIAKDLLTYFAGIELIIQNFTKNSQKPHDNNYRRTRYRIYHCRKAQNFIDIVKNQSVRNLWIFGHGNISNLFLGDGNLAYNIFDGTPDYLKKNFIAQLHCNNQEGNPSTYYLCENLDRSWMTPGLHTPGYTRNEVKKILINQEIFF